MISPHSFTWNGHNSTSFSVVSNLAFDSDDGDTAVISREAVLSETYNNELKRGYNYKWSESLEVTVTLIKNDFSDFTFEENKRILAWLTSKQTPGFLSIYKDENNISYEILGNWTSASQYKIGNNRIVGYVCVFSSLMSHAVSPIRQHEYTITSPRTITITCDTPSIDGSVFDGLIYPKITVTHRGLSVETNQEFAEYFTNYKRVHPDYLAGTVYKYNNKYYWFDATSNSMIQSSTVPDGISTTSVKIENTTLGVSTTVKYSTPDEIITIDGANKVISSDRQIGRIFGDEFNWAWLPLKYGDNTIRITGNCDVKIEYREPIMAGDMVG